VIWDSFIFFNEFELLELRLNELDGLVDRYVICEATLTHAGKRKPLHYAEHADDPELRPFRARIVHVIVDDVPVEAPNRWVRALHQRDAISRGRAGCAPDDLILVSDTDEIPRPSAIRLADQRLGSGLDNGDVPPGGIEGHFIRFHMKVYMSWLNAYKNPGWPGTLAARARIWGRARAGDALRWKGPKRIIAGCGQFGLRDVPVIKDAGWHFTTMGSVERVSEKIRAWEYPQYERPDILDPDTMTRRIKAGEDVFGRPHPRRTRVPIDDTFPHYLQTRPERFKHLIWSAEDVL